MFYIERYIPTVLKKSSLKIVFSRMKAEILTITDLFSDLNPLT